MKRLALPVDNIWLEAWNKYLRVYDNRTSWKSNTLCWMRQDRRRKNRLQQLEDVWQMSYNVLHVLLSKNQKILVCLYWSFALGTLANSTWDFLYNDIQIV